MTDLFLSPGMIAISSTVILMEILSLGFLGLCISEFRLLKRRHASFFHAIGDKGYEHKEKLSTLFLWIYVALTIAATLVTGFFFIFQPHLLSP